ncbi:MAG: PSD1 domain-containing protein [Planctomyces sp.]|nr:PSD1 domain-containing protein [Planctomyces sp.]
MTSVAVICTGAAVAGEEQNRALHFESDIRPLLKAHCWHCHGEESELKGGLDARLVRSLLKGGETGASVVAGRKEDSILWQRIQAGEMPPGKKKLSTEELSLIGQWIDQGIQTKNVEPEVFSADIVLREEAEQHWAFRSIHPSEVPAIRNAQLAANPIDAFLLSELEEHDVSFSDKADRATLIRRASFDLTGLPPSAEAVERFVNAESEDAWPQLIEELLASPAYGERWGRHWLDVVGYADSDGYTEQDPERKWAWKYRDYVIRSLNADKPWNQFIVEQLAGDELLTPPYQDLTAEQADQLTATGFLRMGPDGTSSSGVDQNLARNDVMADTIRVVSTSILGLSVGCAQCHEHRYDPISQSDYYRLRAIFEPGYDWQNWRAPNERLVSMWSAEIRATAASVDAELADVSRQRTEALDAIVAETFERELQKLPAELQPLARSAREAKPDQRTEAQNQLIREYPFLNVDRGSVYLYLPDRLTGFNKTWDDRTEEVRKKRPADDLVMCLTEVPGQVPVTRVFSRGDFQQPRDEVQPGELTVLNSGDFRISPDDELLPTTGRRLAYAKHLTSGHHPLVARVLVNRFWMHHFGRGLVGTPSDFGVKGERPSHPELLDWLASDFMREGWSLKRFHRMVLTSNAWQQTSVRRPELEAFDPENRLLGRMSIRRLEAETVRDALLASSGQLVNKQFGSPVPVSPDDVGQNILAIDTRDSAGRPSGTVIPLGDEEFRRSIYAQVRRSMPLSVLEPFDLPTMTPNCEQRASSTGPSQSLLMMNNEFVRKQSEQIAQRIIRENGSEPRAQIESLWMLLFSRRPDSEDISTATEFLMADAAAIAAGVSPPGDGSVPGSTPAAADASSHVPLAHLCHALISSNGFLYVD